MKGEEMPLPPPGGPPGKITYCPKCNAPLQKGDERCPGCGIDLGKAFATVMVGQPGSAGGDGLVIDAGGMVAPIVAGAIAAVICGIVWACIASWTGLESGWIAWGCGVLVGITVAKLHPEKGAAAGTMAAVLAVIGILLGKMFIYQFALPALMVEEVKKDKMQQAMFNAQALAWYLAQDGVLSPEEEALFNGTTPMVNPAQLQEVVKSFQAKIEAKMKALAAADLDKIMLDYADHLLQNEISFSKACEIMFSGWDILWVFLAIASAWSICNKT